MNLYYCYYNNPEYWKLANECAASFHHYGLHVNVYSLQNRNKWMLNCMSRAPALQAMAEIHSGDGVGLLDADLTCYKTPYRLIKFHNSPDHSGDVAVHDKAADKTPMPCANSRYSAGVICFAPTPLGRACLRRWAELCVDDKDKGQVLREQLYLEKAIEEGRKEGLVVYNLGVHYNQPVSSETVVLHHVESRRSRDKIGGGM